MEVLAGLIALLLVALAVHLLVRQGYGDGRPVLLERMLRRQSDAAAQQALASGGHAFAVAVRTCVHCSEAAQCRAWLASGARDGFEPFCPNSGYVERMRRLTD
jgi:hypothetical protein